MAEDRKDRGGRRLSLELLFATATLLTVIFLVMGARALRTPAPLWADGVVLGYVDAIHSGRLYSHEALSHEPYLVLAHPPLSYALSALFAHLAPLQFWPLRLLTLLATLATAFIVGAIVYHQSGRRARPALFAGCVFLLMPPILIGSYLARNVDILTVGFSAAALLALVRLRPGIARDVAVALLFCGAALSKQTALGSLGLTLLAWRVMRREWGAAARTFGVAGGVLALVTIGLQWHTRGGFLENVLFANLMPMSAAFWRKMALANTWPLWAFALALFVVGGARPSLATIYFGAGALVGLVTCARTGATPMYFADAATGLALLSGEVFARLDRDASLRWTRPLILLLALATCVERGVPYLGCTDPLYAGEYARLLALLRSGPLAAGPLMSDDPGVALQLGQAPVWNDGFIFGQNARDGRWDCAPLAGRLARGEFGAVVTTGRAAWWPEPMCRALAARYALARQFHMSAGEPYTVYLRRPPPPPSGR